MRVLVTGHNGYIGSVMVPILQAAGHEVVGLDSFFFEDCSLLQEDHRVPALRKDLRDVRPWDLDGFGAVAHLAALCNDPLGDLHPEWTYDINHKASVQLASMARAAGVARFLHASSCSMYGAAGGDDLLSEEAPLRPLTPYAISKVRTEEDVSKLADRSFSPVFMRNATAYGLSPRLRADVVLNNLVCWAHTTGRIRIMSDGTPWRPIVHVQDIARAFAAALSAPREAIHNQAFNVGANGENYQVRELAEIVRDTVPGCAVEYADGAGPDPRSYRVNFS
ncbi:MAG: NAD-dependent epimerase/dehydratase family protein, partial [Candidatus Rokuibacteriota bacterium]